MSRFGLGTGDAERANAEVENGIEHEQDYEGGNPGSNSDSCCSAPPAGVTPVDDPDPGEQGDKEAN